MSHLQDERSNACYIENKIKANVSKNSLQLCSLKILALITRHRVKDLSKMTGFGPCLDQGERDF